MIEQLENQIRKLKDTAVDDMLNATSDMLHMHALGRYQAYLTVLSIINEMSEAMISDMYEEAKKEGRA